MQSIELNAQLKTENRKTVNRAIRSEGLVSAVLYGPKMTPVMLTLDCHDFTRVIFHSPAREHSLLKINIEGGKSEMALIREVQFHPVTDRVVHVDLLHIHEGYKTVFQLPVVFNGTPVGIKVGGTFQTTSHQLKIKANPMEVPDTIEINVSEMNLGDTIHIKDLSIPGISFVAAQDYLLAAVHAPKSTGLEPTDDES
jgi:large subunit ribosomal protein L25